MSYVWHKILWHWEKREIDHKDATDTVSVFFINIKQFLWSALYSPTTTACLVSFLQKQLSLFPRDEIAPCFCGSGNSNLMKEMFPRVEWLFLFDLFLLLHGKKQFTTILLNNTYCSRI